MYIIIARVPFGRYNQATGTTQLCVLNSSLCSVCCKRFDKFKQATDAGKWQIPNSRYRAVTSHVTYSATEYFTLPEGETRKSEQVS